MGYRKIPNLYKDRLILDHFKEVYAMEKIHGTSAHIAYKKDLTTKEETITFFPGGVKLDPFTSLFDRDALMDSFREMGREEIIIFGEAYGGSCQRMSAVYGKELRFIAFEVKVDHHWLSVEKAANVVQRFGLEFVHWVKGPATKEFVNAQRDAPSELAIRRGTGTSHTREGVVLRPTIEVKLNNGERLLAKHKHPDFRETATPREIDPAKQKHLSIAKEVAEEYVVQMRLEHVLDKFVAEKMADPTISEYEVSMKDTKEIKDRMIADISLEEGDVIEWSKDVAKAIGARTAQLLKKHVIARI